MTDRKSPTLAPDETTTGKDSTPMPADPTSQEHLAYVLRFHTEMAAKLCPPGGRMGFIFGSLCSAAGIEDDEFDRLLDIATGVTDE